MGKVRRKRFPSGIVLAIGLGFLIPFATVIVGWAVIGVWPFGDGTVLIIDSIHQYLPFYTELHEKLQAGESLLYDFSAGFGYDFWATFAYYLASPLNFLMALLPTRNVADYMDYVIALKIGLCGATFTWYLWRRDSGRIVTSIAFGTMFALSNFLIGYYFNLMWLDSIAMTPLIMAGIERIARDGKGRLYGLSLFFALWCNYYIGFMLCLFSCLYLMVCLAAREGLSLVSFLKRCVRFGLFSLLAGGMSMALLLPAYMSLTSSEAMQSPSVPKLFVYVTNFADMILAHFATWEPINISDTQVGLNAYCGTAVLILTVLYILDTKIAWREKLGRLLLGAFFLYSFADRFFSYVWHGFHTQNGLPNRFAFLYVLMLLVMSYDVLGHIKELPVWKIPAAAAPALIFAIWAVASGLTGQEGNWQWTTAALLIVHLIFLLLGRCLRFTRREACAILGIFLAAEAVVHGVWGIAKNGRVTRSIYLADQESWKEMVGRTGDTDFFRSEIDSQRMRNVTMFAGGNSTVMFNSTMLASVTNFCDRIGMEGRTNKNGYNGVTALMNDVFGIRYVLSSNGKGDRLYGMERIDEDGNLTLYKNEDALSIGFLVNPEIRYWDIEQGDPIDVQNAFVQLATDVESLYNLEQTLEADDEEKIELLVPQDGQMYLYLPSRVEKLVLNTPEYSKTYSSFTDHLYSINALGGDAIADVTLYLKDTQDRQTLWKYTCSDTVYREVLRQLSEDQLENVTAWGNRLTGTVSASKPGILFLTVPYDKNWSVKVDGEKVQALKLGGTFTGIELQEGEHEISMVYTPGGFFPGVLLSLLSLAGMIVLILWEKGHVETEGENNMEIKFSRMAQQLGAGIFARLDEKKEELAAQGRTIYNLSVGTPDFCTPQNIMDAVSEAARDPENYKYSLKDLPQLKEALAAYYMRRYGVELKMDEMMSIYGSQEGMAHIAWALCDPGDLVLVPNPGYPIFKTGPQLCGARTWEYPLLAENNYLPQLDQIPEEVRREARYMVVSYPGNPLCKAAPDAFYEELIAFAKRNNIIIVHDNAYSDIVFGGKNGKSFLSFEGAKEVGVEFFSLSKTFDYTGARMSFVVGNAQIVEKFSAIRSQFDYGIFLPVQYGAIAALCEPDEAVHAQCDAYEKRSRTLTEGLRSIGWDVPDTDGTMFVWAPLPGKRHDSTAFTLELMERAGVICTPGISFGSLGEGHVRFALVLPPEKLQEAVEAIRRSGIIDGSKPEE